MLVGHDRHTERSMCPMSLIASLLPKNVLVAVLVILTKSLAALKVVHSFVEIQGHDRIHRKLTPQPPPPRSLTQAQEETMIHDLKSI